MSSSTPTVTTVREVRSALLTWRERGESVAFVPTMGALHRGHLALIERARSVARRVVVSIFVNPLQFGPNEDLARYPRQLEADQKLLADAGCDLLYAPEAAAMYPEGFAISIQPGPLSAVLEGAFRPGHFAGVATVVVKLLLQILPDVAIFGEKDYQQLQIIQRVVHDLDLPVHIMGIPIVREPDGLALSSRNAYLSPEERAKAVALPQALADIAIRIRNGGPVDDALEAGRKKLAEAGFKVDYLELADARTLQPVRKLAAPARLLAAAKIGTTRLIDNLAVDKG